MKIIVNKSSLEAAVKNLTRVINQKNALPILADIHFDVNETAKTARLTASDSEVTLSYEVILTECEGGGKFCVNAKTLSAMLVEISEQPLSITATLESDMKFTMTYKDGSAFCLIEPADEYPLPVNGEYIETLKEISGDWLRDALKRSMWATSNNELQPIMTGVNFALIDGYLDIVASNGHVLVKSHKSFADKVALNRCGSFIMPKKAAKVLTSIIENENMLDIEWNDSEAHINMNGYDIFFRLIDGRYPNYNSIIPQEYAHEVQFQRTDLLSAAKTVAPFTPESSQMLVLTFEEEKMEVRGEDYDLGEGAVKSISIDEYNGDPLSIGVKSSSLTNILSKLSMFDVLLKLNDPSRAIVIEPIDEKADSKEEITCLLMPMIIND